MRDDGTTVERCSNNDNNVDRQACGYTRPNKVFLFTTECIGDRGNGKG